MLQIVSDKFIELKKIISAEFGLILKIDNNL